MLNYCLQNKLFPLRNVTQILNNNNVAENEQHLY